jgi:hypothetical protein
MWKVQIIECEKGWGQRVDEIEEFDSYEEAESFRNGFNSKNNLDYVPDWYMYASDPYNDMPGLMMD